MWVIGTQDGTDVVPAVEAVMLGVVHASRGPKSVTFVHGNASGLDRIVWNISERRHWYQELHPVTRENYAQDGQWAPLRRNDRMIALGADLCIGFPHGRANTQGTWYTLTHAKDAGIPTYFALRMPAGSPHEFALSEVGSK